MVGVQKAAREGVEDERLIAADLETSALRNARSLVKVPPIGAACSPVAACGRYVFTPAIWSALRDSTDAMLTATIRALMERERVFACVVDGHRFDCGTKLGFLEAQFAFAQKRRELWPGLRMRLGCLLTDEAPAREAPASLATASDAKAAIMR